MKKVVFVGASFLLLYCLVYVLMAMNSGYTPLRIYSKFSDHHYDYTPAWLCAQHDTQRVRTWPGDSRVAVYPWYYLFLPVVLVDRALFHPDGPAPVTLPDPIHGLVSAVTDAAVIITLADAGAVNDDHRDSEFIILRGDDYICRVRVVGVSNGLLECRILTETMNSRGHPIRIGDQASTRLW